MQEVNGVFVVAGILPKGFSLQDSQQSAIPQAEHLEAVGGNLSYWMYIWSFGVKRGTYNHRIIFLDEEQKRVLILGQHVKMYLPSHA